ncbi:hypothetical protein NEMBOFW57_004238 [Staphylotrichum longicolle]|uniref:F-box domain-containing protein n=1 Tax=Staphylotrichum longicolle TaxID=669026 RepID=A0AAD4I094_9PEZI|nr:hypothetical protein NEMBOFW57_004238 [Staphylotrichum longicolle]
MQWGHDYEGSTAQAEDPSALPPGEEGRVIRSVVIGIHYMDPLEIPQLQPLFENMDQADEDRPSPGGSPSLQRCSATHHTDPFARLPAEILQTIVTQLPTPDVAALRRASRAWAGLSLHDLFWRSRFQPGGEFEFVFEAASHFSRVRGRWQEIYHGVKALQYEPLQSQVCMQNRKRVWHLASSLRDLMSKARGTECEGADNYVQELLDDPHWITACRGLHELRHDLSYGSRMIFQRSVNVPDDAVGLFVSMIDIFGRRYVSGIRIQQADGHSTKIDNLPALEIVSPDVANVDAELVQSAYISQNLAEASGIDPRVSRYEILDNGSDSAVFSIDLKQLVGDSIFIQINSLLSKKLRIPLLQEQISVARDCELPSPPPISLGLFNSAVRPALGIERVRVKNNL